MITQSDINQSRAFAIEAARLLANTRCHNVIVLDVSGLSPVTDFMIIATGTSDRQINTASDEVREFGEPRGFKALSQSGDGGNWTCTDMVDVVVHVFSSESRAYYDLENLWGDARKVAWQMEAPVTAKAR